jgi:predicted RNA binding protein YcfA (HicA-like mRNA interferase family)
MDAMATYEVEVRIMIPRHQTEEIPAGTLNRILKDLGLTRDQV